MTTVLMVLTAADHWTLDDGTKHPTGFWAEEFAVPYDLFTAAGYDVTVATPNGTPPTVDEISLGVAGGLPPATKKLRDRLGELAPVLEHPAVLADVDPLDYDLVFYPGGHGPMEDLAVDPVSGDLLARRLESGKLMALLCHAPAAISAATRPDGANPFAGRTMTGLSNAEERLNSFGRKAIWTLEDRLKELGVEYEKAMLPLRPYVVRDGNLWTGQNPASSKRLAESLIAVLEGRPDEAKADVEAERS